MKRLLVVAALVAGLAVPAAAQDNFAAWNAYASGDYAAALKIWSTLAEQGDATAQLALGKLYQRGLGVPEDHVLSHKWYSLAAAQDNGTARSSRDFLEEFMTSAQIAEAQRLAREWRPAQQATSETLAPPPPTPASTGERIALIQHQLASLGHDPGPIDGIHGLRTRAAIRGFQAREGLPITGVISERLEAELRSANAARASRTAQ